MAMQINRLARLIAKYPPVPDATGSQENSALHVFPAASSFFYIGSAQPAHKKDVAIIDKRVHRSIYQQLRATKLIYGFLDFQAEVGRLLSR